MDPTDYVTMSKLIIKKVADFVGNIRVVSLPLCGISYVFTEIYDINLPLPKEGVNLEVHTCKRNIYLHKYRTTFLVCIDMFT